MYDYAWNKVRNYSGTGVGQDEAALYHRRAYGGFGDLQNMAPLEVGAAAAYEAWRTWKAHYGVYGQPISGDRERQREALTGLAVGEAARLWQYTGRVGDSYGRLESSEAAASTASLLLTQSWAYDTSYGDYDAPDPYAYRGRLSRRNSVASLRGRSMSRPRTPFDRDGYAGSSYGGGYDSASVYGGADAYDGYAGSAYGAPGRIRSRSFSSVGAPALMSTPSMSMPAAMTPSVSYAGSAVQGYGYPANYGTPYTQYASPSAVSVYSSPSRRRSRSRHRHGRHRHRHGSSGSYYVASAAPSYGY